jgi:hypothetical protein
MKSGFKYKSLTLSPKTINFDLDFYLRTSHNSHSYTKHQYIFSIFLAVAYSALCGVRKETLYTVLYNLNDSQPSKTVLEVGGPEQIHSLIHFCKTFHLRYERLCNQRLHAYKILQCIVLLLLCNVYWNPKLLQSFE